MKPYQILVFFLSVILILLFIAMVFPDRELRISDEYSLKFIRIDEIIGKEEVQYADISGIIESSKRLKELKEEVFRPDSIYEEPFLATDTIRANADSLREITHLIEFSPGCEKLLDRLFLRFYNLTQSGELIRILHYGDSQIESDRITGIFRHRLQMKFGGMGGGMVPPVPLYHGKRSIRQEYSENWIRYTGFANVDSTIKHKRFGPLFAFSTFHNKDSTQKSTAWLKFEPSPYAYITSRNFRRVSLLFGGSCRELLVKTFISDSLADSSYHHSSNGFIKLEYHTEKTPGEIRFHFEGFTKPEVYAVSMDGDYGVAVDNIPLRGSSGLFFSKSDTSLLRKIYQELNIGMLVLQFGGNIVPHQANSYDFYRRYFSRELRTIKKILPGVPVIVIGPSDMSMKDRGNYVTYSSLEPVRDALRSAALENDFAFWDMYEAMGGKNSMPSWVWAEPSLAVSDFVHFNTRGAQIIGEMFYNALLYEYKQWLNSRQMEELVVQ